MQFALLTYTLPSVSKFLLNTLFTRAEPPRGDVRAPVRWGEHSLRSASAKVGGWGLHHVLAEETQKELPEGCQQHEQEADLYGGGWGGEGSLNHIRRRSTLARLKVSYVMISLTTKGL